MTDQNSLDDLAKQFAAIPMEELIGAPLNAGAKGIKQLDQARAKFILETCFQEDNIVEVGGAKPSTKKLKPTMIEVELSSPTANSSNNKAVPESETVTFDLPLISLIPIRSVVQDNITLDTFTEIMNETGYPSVHGYDVEIESSVSPETQDDAAGDAINLNVRHSIDCPCCSQGEIHFELSSLMHGLVLLCSDSNCISSIKLPEQSLAPLKNLIEGLKFK